MKIAIASDIHLEFGMIDDEIFENVDAEVLVLAGDIGIHRWFKRKDAAIIDFFEYNCLKNFEHVIYIMGNHEHYKGLFNDTAKFIRECIPEKVHFLDREYAFINDVKFVGCTLWTNYNNTDPLAMYKARQKINDHRVIKYKVDNRYRKFLPEDALTTHIQDLHFIKEELKFSNIFETKVVVVTHHLPVQECIPQRFRETVYHDNNGAYANHLEEFILEYEPTLWIHGHTHDSVDIELGNTRIVCNPRGYFGVEKTDDYQLKIVEI